MVVEAAGRTGMLFHSPVGAPGVDGEALAEVIRGVTDDALGAGMSMIQSLLPPADGADVAAVRAGGYTLLADLLYLRRPLNRPVAEPDAGLTWRRFGEFDDAELLEVIGKTYSGSLDCPRLSGARRGEDILASHRDTGIYNPDTWWLAMRGGEPAGCILVNDVAARSEAEVVYLGVTPVHRGRGVGRAMLRRALRASAQRGLSAMTLAVDAANTYAIRIYEHEGFSRYDRRLAHAVLAGERTPCGACGQRVD